ncbi:MAG: putative secondary metabolism biosynthetic enzyme [Chrysothrix sp. TS-e1954]|nr:MAG: putative secondary metabolism biosynthetic enzyme [Chrysothrix sp. TS-e1954]
MAFPYKKVLVVGATSGIGYALADQIAANGTKVIVSGRRSDRLQEFVQSHGSSLASSYTFDITKTSAMRAFIIIVTKDNPDLDCVILSSGVQRVLDFSKPNDLDLENFEDELMVNYTAQVHLSNHFVRLFADKTCPTALVFVSSGLGLVPLPRVPGYSASKAALHTFVLCLRKQISETHKHMSIIEIIPPMVKTELHDNQVGGQYGRKFGMPLEEFNKAAWEGLCAEKKQIPVGMTLGMCDGFEGMRQKAMENMVANVAKMQQGL